MKALHEGIVSARWTEHSDDPATDTRIATVGTINHSRSSPAPDTQEDHFSVAVLSGGRAFRVRPEMAKIFVATATALLRRGESESVVLSHQNGVDLLHVGAVSLIVVLDERTQPPVVLWRSTLQTPEPTPPAAALPDSPTTPRSRILTAAYPIVVLEPTRAIDVDTVRDRAHVTAAEFAAEFETIEQLVAECVRLRDREWTIGVIRTAARAIASTPQGRLLAIFDVLDNWLHRHDAEATALLSALLTMGKDHPEGRATAAHLTYVRSLIAGLANEAGLNDPQEFALSWHLLMKGAVINAIEGDDKAALRARAMADDLIRRHQP